MTTFEIYFHGTDDEKQFPLLSRRASHNNLDSQKLKSRNIQKSRWRRLKFIFMVQMMKRNFHFFRSGPPITIYNLDRQKYSSDVKSHRKCFLSNVSMKNCQQLNVKSHRWLFHEGLPTIEREVAQKMQMIIPWRNVNNRTCGRTENADDL